MTIRVTREDTELILALNAVYLPSNFNALWHSDTQDLEFIWNAIPTDKDLMNRSCELHYDRRTILCEWARASKRLERIANASFRATPIPTETNYRNIIEFRAGMSLRNEEPQKIPFEIGPPTSFWIRNIAWDENFVVSLAHHVNFYMQYYDRQSPIIQIIEEAPQSEKVSLERFPYGGFPERLTAFPLDAYLLHLWSTSVQINDPLRRLLHSYQIIEYAAFYHVKSEVAESVRKILLQPDAIYRVEDVTGQVIEAMSANNMDDPAKFRSVLKDYVDPAALWHVIEPYRSTFSKTLVFDGGFSLEPLIGEKMSFDDFKTNWSTTFSAKLESLRNAAVHAREKRNSNSLAPTRKNHDLLWPWATLALRAAEQVMIFQKR